MMALVGNDSRAFMAKLEGFRAAWAPENMRATLDALIRNMKGGGGVLAMGERARLHEELCHALLEHNVRLCEELRTLRAEAQERPGGEGTTSKQVVNRSNKNLSPGGLSVAATVDNATNNGTGEGVAEAAPVGAQCQDSSSKPLQETASKRTSDEEIANMNISRWNSRTRVPPEIAGAHHRHKIQLKNIDFGSSSLSSCSRGTEPSADENVDDGISSEEEMDEEAIKMLRAPWLFASSHKRPGLTPQHVSESFTASPLRPDGVPRLLLHDNTSVQKPNSNVQQSGQPASECKKPKAASNVSIFDKLLAKIHQDAGAAAAMFSGPMQTAPAAVTPGFKTDTDAQKDLKAKISPLSSNVETGASPGFTSSSAQRKPILWLNVPKGSPPHSPHISPMSKHTQGAGAAASGTPTVGAGHLEAAHGPSVQLWLQNREGETEGNETAEGPGKDVNAQRQSTLSQERRGSNSPYSVHRDSIRSTVSSEDGCCLDGEGPKTAEEAWMLHRRSSLYVEGRIVRLTVLAAQSVLAGTPERNGSASLLQTATPQAEGVGAGFSLVNSSGSPSGLSDKYNLKEVSRELVFSATDSDSTSSTAAPVADMQAAMRSQGVAGVEANGGEGVGGKEKGEQVQQVQPNSGLQDNSSKAEGMETGQQNGSKDGGRGTDTSQSKPDTWIQLNAMAAKILPNWDIS